MKNFEIGAIVLGLLAGTVQADPVQWSVADGGNGHWYEAVLVDESDAGSWEVYRDYANAMGGHLATLSTEEENAWVKNNIANDPALWDTEGSGCVCLGPYIGAYREADDDQWTWIDGSEWAFTDWHPGNPDGPPATSSCILLWDLYGNNNGYAWQDTSSSGTKNNSYSFIVEWPTQPPVQWRIEDGGNGHWYQLVESGKGFLWSEAVAEAESRGGYLVSLTSADEDAWVYANFDADNRWIGVFQDTNAADYSEPSGGWRWLSGETLDYSNWNGGGPDNGGVVDAPAEEYAHYCCGGAWNDIYGVDSFGVFVRKQMMVEYTTLPGSALGACCLDGLCITTASADCEGHGGSWGGAHSSCTDFNCPENCPADVDGDGDVGVSDILMIIASWGACP